MGCVIDSYHHMLGSSTSPRATRGGRARRSLHRCRGGRNLVACDIVYPVCLRAEKRRNLSHAGVTLGRASGGGELKNLAGTYKAVTAGTGHSCASAR